MAKLTRAQYEGHAKAKALLGQTSLSIDDKLFVFENYREDAENINSAAGAYFTPPGLANDFVLHIPFIYGKKVKILDLCAGIGALTYAALVDIKTGNTCEAEFICVENNLEYVEVGKKLVPEAEWWHADALDPEFLQLLGRFHCVIANPPFGNIKSQYKDSYASGSFEYMVIEAASRISDHGVFLIPQMSAPFVYSGANYYREVANNKLNRFSAKTGIDLESGIGVDTAQYKADWHGVSPLCEIVCCDFTREEQDKSGAA